MDIHVNRLGVLNILFGVVSALFSIGVLLVRGTPIELYHSMGDHILAAVLVVLLVFHLVLAIPCMIGGFYLRSYAEWARGVLTVTSALNFLNPPFGSALGCYGLWVLLTPETDPLFRRPARKASKSRTAKGAEVVSDTRPAGPKPSTSTAVPSPRS